VIEVTIKKVMKTGQNNGLKSRGLEVEMKARESFTQQESDETEGHRLTYQEARG